MKIYPIKTGIFQEKENLLAFIFKYIKKIREGSVLVITSKIVSLAEGRTLPLPKNDTAKAKIIVSESSWAIPTKYVWLTKKDGMIMANAGIDESNANGKIVLLPKDSYRMAKKIRWMLLKKFDLKNCGVLITDSRTQPLRAGIIGSALGYAGFKGIKNYKGTKDIFGRTFLFSSANIADCLATSAVLVMGEGNEQQPLALIEQAPITFSSRVTKKESSIDLQDDIYLPLLKNFK